MDIKRRIINHNKRWNIELNEEEELQKFKNRLINNIASILCDFITEDFEHFTKMESCFANFYGDSDPWPTPNAWSDFQYANNPLEEFSSIYTYKILEKRIKKSANIKCLATALQYLFWAIEKSDNSNLVIDLYQAVKEVIYGYPMVGIGIKVAIRDSSVIVYPEGAKLLDEAAVNDVLAWLEDYPKVAKHFEQALTIYMHGDKS